jgi:hypothetical protein
MKMQDFFIGRPVYWVLTGAITAIMAVMGLNKMHVREFVPFQFTVLALAAVAVAAIILVYKPGERATRESLDPQDEE